MRSDGRAPPCRSYRADGGYRQFWEVSCVRLDGLLSELKATEKKRKRVAPKKR